MIKTIKDFNPAKIKDLEGLYTYGAYKDGYNLTTSLDNKAKADFDQQIINEIVLWKVNRYVNVENADWMDDFNKLKFIDELDGNQTFVKSILSKMLKTHGIRLPMASTMLRFRNPNVFQIIDVRTFRVIYGDDAQKKKIMDANDDNSIELYFEYLLTLKKVCAEKGIVFSDADRILYQYDIEENK
ncbi:hypothetical protein [Mucilaginibacter flavus]|uniref:hypothetical protein n=1 Tax=Mucilaginibacter flavus TaxID=931504 RepID=UPI0025B33563|nr:hypothetical protein [Mucilaginibacter flavus]